MCGVFAYGMNLLTVIGDMLYPSAKLKMVMNFFYYKVGIYWQGVCFLVSLFCYHKWALVIALLHYELEKKKKSCNVFLFKMVQKGFLCVLTIGVVQQRCMLLCISTGTSWYYTHSFVFTYNLISSFFSILYIVFFVFFSEIGRPLIV